jgi:hypothetical protein
MFAISGVRLLRTAAALVCTASCASGPDTMMADALADADTVIVTIETRIMPSDPVSGMKSLQTIEVDFVGRTVSQHYETGTTYGIPSVRNDFKVTDASFNHDGVRFRAMGETATGVLIIPNINYDFTLEIGRDGSAVLRGGCHDGYPAYTVNVGGRTLYRFMHEPIRLFRLAGDCDVRLPRRALSPRTSQAD